MKKMEYKIDMKKGNQSNYIFDVTVTPEQKKACHDAVLLEYQKEAVQPGFRKGHVPLNMVEKLANPANIFRVVVLPQPLGPNKVRNSFFLILRDRFFKTVLSP